MRAAERYAPLAVLGWLLLGLTPYILGDWIPTDEGLLAQSAERVLAGQLPHRDFDDPYTGLLALLHAGAFKLLGVSMVSTRWTLWAASGLLAGGVYGIGRRVTSPGPATLAALLALSLGVSRYFASMPSWYNGICALAFLWALLRWQDTRSGRWLLLAGLAAGVSVLFKVIGVYLIPAGLLVLLDGERSAARDAGGRGGRGMFALLAGGLGLFVGALLQLLRFRLDGADLAQLLLPSALLGGALLLREWREPGGPLGARLPTLLRGGALLLLGLLLPLLLFLLPYGSDAGAVLLGVFVAPFSRLDGVTAPLPPLPLSLLAALPLGGLLLLGATRGVSRRLDLAAAGLLLGAAALLIVLRREPAIYQASVLFSVQLLPFAVAAAVALGRPGPFAVAAVASLFAFVQLPYWHPINSAYTAPLLVLLALYVGAASPSAPRRALLSAGVGALLVGALVLSPAADGFSRDRYLPFSERGSALLALPRARGLGVSPDEKRIYEQVCADVAAHSAPGEAIWAGPDSPEIYFLCERRNPTRMFYEVLADPADREAQILAALEREQVRVVVLNRAPDFSRLSGPFGQALFARFPHSADRQWYEVRWRQQ